MTQLGYPILKSAVNDINDVKNCLCKLKKW